MVYCITNVIYYSYFFHFQCLGPLVNSEYYPAWLDYWGIPHNILSPKISAKSFDNYLSYKNASVSVYMAHGGTSFGFEAGITNEDCHNFSFYFK